MFVLYVWLGLPWYYCFCKVQILLWLLNILTVKTNTCLFYFIPDVPTQPRAPMAHKQTQITTNTIFVKPPPPPPTPPPPAPKQVKNKITLCKPYAVSKSVTCKPITKNAEAQAGKLYSQPDMLCQCGCVSLSMGIILPLIVCLVHTKYRRTGGIFTPAAARTN